MISYLVDAVLLIALAFRVGATFAQKIFLHETHGPRRSTVGLFVQELFTVDVQTQCSSTGGREHQILFVASVVSSIFHLVPSLAGFAMYTC